MSEKSAKDLLLDQVVDHFVAEGMGDLSLRKIAAAIGTSHRMLLYHFGSREGLLAAVCYSPAFHQSGESSTSTPT